MKRIIGGAMPGASSRASSPSGSSPVWSEAASRPVNAATIRFHASLKRKLIGPARLSDTAALRGLCIGDDDHRRAPPIGLEESEVNRRSPIDEDAFDQPIEIAGDPMSAAIAGYGKGAAAIDTGRQGDMRALRHDEAPSERI